MNGMLPNETEDPVALETQKQVFGALFERLRRRIVPIIATAPDGHRGVEGAGSLFMLSGKRFLITAAHVLGDPKTGTVRDLKRLAVPRFPGREGTGLVELGNAHVQMGPRSHDVAIVAIDDSGIGYRLSDQWQYLSAADILRGSAEQCDAFLIAGFPMKMAREVEVNELAAGFHMQSGRLFKGAIDTIQTDPLNKDVDLLLTSSEDFANLWGKTIASPKLQGVSGSAVWAVRRPQTQGIWSLEDMIRICAVQSSAKYGAFVRGKRLHVVVSLLERLDPAAAREFGTALDDGIVRAGKT